MPAGPPPAAAVPTAAAPIEAPVVEAPVIETPPPSTQAAAGASTADQFDGLPPEVFESELKRARQDAAKERERRKKFEDAFEGYEPDEIETYLGMVQDLARDPSKAYESFQATTERIREALAAEGKLSPQGASDPKYLTREDLKQIELERETDKAIQAIQNTAVQLGYTPDTREHAALLWTAAKDPRAESDVTKAHEIIKADRDAIGAAAVEAYIASLNEPKHPPVAGGSPGAPGATGATAPAPAGKYSAKHSALQRLTEMGY